jgi:hypothetical protein
VKIPNHFIVNGVQQDDSKNVIPTADNSVALGLVFDKNHLLRNLKFIGIRAELSTFNLSKSEEQERSIPCQGMAAFDGLEDDPSLVTQILDMFKPSKQLQGLVETIKRTIITSTNERDMKDGICVHHRDGKDWHDHCAKWKSIDDGIYRGNCLTLPGGTFVEALTDRGLSKDQNFIYYCGDHDDIPRELEGYDVVRRLDLLSTPMNLDDIMQLEDTVTSMIVPRGVNKKNIDDNNKILVTSPQQNSFRDLWAWIDYVVCQSFDSFIGNSVSTFSALQIAQRQQQQQQQQHQDGSFKSVSWYNSQSIPLGDFWDIYTIPIVYTYTELSSPSGKFLLKVSILSARSNLPNTAIHILYHGNKDHAFLTWLQNCGVIIHEHWPSWAQEIEDMRLNGDPNASHLFLHAGNFLGTWQRIDIPLFIQSEYCLLLDSDTIIMQPFTARNFGLDLTLSIAMSDEVDLLNIPFNAGVTLMNVPHLRRTYQEFLNFILEHKNSAMFNVRIGAMNFPTPSDQGAYLEFFYTKTNKGSDARNYLSRSFNVKPYWNFTKLHVDPYILHFHGTKPAEYIDVMTGGTCKGAGRIVCERAINDNTSYLCQGMHVFSKYAKELEFDSEFCQIHFPGEHSQNKALMCKHFLTLLSMERYGKVCDGHYLSDVATNVKSRLHTTPMENFTDQQNKLPEVQIDIVLRNALKMEKGEIHPIINIPLLFASTNVIFIAFMVKNLRQTQLIKFRLK